MSSERFSSWPALDEQDALPPAHSRGRRLLALVVAALLLGFVVLAAGGSLFGRPATPENTRPLPPLIPTQGALR